MINIESCCRFLIIFISLIVEIAADDGDFFLTSFDAEKNPCDFDINNCKSGICRETEKVKNRNYLCACPPKKTGTICDQETPDCRQCTDKGRKECTGFPDETAFCICHAYKNNKFSAPSICFFYNKAKPDRQKVCEKGEHKCTRGEQCVNYAQDDNEMAQVCQCPVGNTRGRDCEEDYEVDNPGAVYSCVDTNQIGPLCMCRKYGKNGDEYGFCKPSILKATLIDALIDNGPCSLDKNKCRNGECIMKNANKSFCACANKYTGKYCHFDMPHCKTCKNNMRKECSSLDDGSAVCICWEYTSWKIKAPSICFFPKAKDDRQIDCGNGIHHCDRGERCVNYAQVQAEKHEVCVCPAGKTRGKSCIEDFKFIEVPDDGNMECVYTGAFGAFCLCYQYGSRGDEPGFCKAIIEVHGAVVKPKGSGGPCDISSNKCHRGICTETPLFEEWDFLCACPLPWTGELCHYEMLHCSRCKKYAMMDCISLPDNTAVCVCVELDNVRDRQPPLICRYDQAKPDRQKSCKRGEHTCDPGQNCINYAQTENSMQVTCTCPAGKKRGKNCNEEYRTSLPGGKFHCVDTILSGTFCLCDVYGQGQYKYGFCVPRQKEMKGVELAEHLGNPVKQNESPCDMSHNICREGTCLETTGAEKPSFVCSCPTKATGTLCHEDTVGCSVCPKKGRRDCIGLPDGTGVCVCVEFEKGIHRQLPAICSWKKALSHRQKDCNRGLHDCTPGQQCMNYAHVEGEMRMTCQCPAGGKRGKDCKEDYQIDNSVGVWPCVDTQGYGPICLCEKYGRGIEQYGFCKPQLASPGAKRRKRNEKSTSSSETYAVGSFSRRSLLSVDYLTTTEMPECWKCKPLARKDCIGLSDKTAYCICTDFSFKGTGEVPAVCHFLQSKDDRQKSCQRGEHNCPPKKKCVNFAQEAKEMHITCVCPEGRFRGENCESEYQLVDWTNGLSCVKTENNGPICMCSVYGHNKKEVGFCKPRSGSKDLPLSTQTTTSSSLLNTVPSISNSELLAIPECWKCKVPARRDCIGLTDKTAYCVCTEFFFEGTGKVPAVCRFEQAKDDRQKSCQRGEHNCPSKKKCVNFAQNDKEMQMTCVCPEGRFRGENCENEYQLISQKEGLSCVETVSNGKICMCNVYGNGKIVGFCKISSGNVDSQQPDTNREQKQSSNMPASGVSSASISPSEMPECSKCKQPARRDCIGLNDKTAFCICTEFSDRSLNAPTICRYLQAKEDRQKSCHRGEHNCPPKKKCVNYAQEAKEMQMTCVCPEGRFRGENCENEYQLLDPQDAVSCVETINNGRICMCNDKNKNVGFCRIDRCGAEVKCKNRACFQFGENGLVCTCPIDKTGPDCGKPSLPCSSCKKEDRKDCIGLLDGTARCICNSPGKGKDPEICFFPKFLPGRQLDCQNGKHGCDPGQQCVNYAQQPNVMQITCQCPVGDKRGENCQERYSRIEPGEETSCVQILGQTPICICNKYGMTPGFCKPMEGTEETDTNDISNVVKNPCEGPSNQCRSGKCYETEEANGRNFYCVCSLEKSGKYCHQETTDCLKCKATIDCIGLSDGTAICVCMEFLAGVRIETPTMCHFRSKPKENRQIECNADQHKCKGDEVCVNYAQEQDKKSKVCQCPLGPKRGPWCDKDFDTPNPAKSFSCVDTGSQGVLCVCDTYMDEPFKFGFCSADPVNNIFAGSRPTGKPLSKDQSSDSPISVPLPSLDETPSESKADETDLEPSSDLQNLMPCSSNPCQNNGLCRLNPALKASDFVCACPVIDGQWEDCNDTMPDCSNVTCINTTECLLWPPEAECICDEEFRKFACALKMTNVKKWEKLKQIISPESSNTTEAVVLICVVVLINMIPICLICHCCRVLSARRKYKAKYDEVVNKGKTPNAPLPAWLDVSNDLVLQTLCCGTSKLPQTFEERKKKKKKDKKDKQKKEEKDGMKANKKKEDLNENSPLKRFGRTSSYRWKDRVRRYSALNASAITRLKLAQNNNMNSTGSKQDYIREYIRSQHSFPRNFIRERLIPRDYFEDDECMPRAYFDDESVTENRYNYSGDRRRSKSSFR